MIPYFIMLGLSVLFASLWVATQSGALQPVNHVPWGKKAVLEIQASRLYLMGAFLPMFLVNSLMYYVGNDYKNYVTIFNQIATRSFSVEDWAYYELNRWLYHIGADFQYVYVICCALGYFLLFKSMRDYSANLAVSVLLYFCCGYFYLLGMNQIRQFVAIGVCLFAYRYMASGKFLKFCLCVLLAASFHFTALVMLPAYFLLRMQLKASYFVVAAIILAPFNLFYNDILTFLFVTFRPQYVGTAYMEKSLIIDMVLVGGALIISLLAMAYYDQLVARNAHNRLFINAIWVATLLLALCGWIPESQRVAYYFTVPLICLVPNILSVEKNKYLRFLYMMGIAGFYLVFYTMQRASNWGVFPYISIFSK